MICNYAVYAAHRPFTAERSGHMTAAQNPEARRNCFRFAEFCTCSMGPGTVRRSPGVALKQQRALHDQIKQATALYYTIPALGKYNTTSHWRRVSMLNHFTNTKSWRHLLLGASLLSDCTDFLSATLFERVPICGPWKQSSTRTTLVEMVMS